MIWKITVLVAMDMVFLNIQLEMICTHFSCKFSTATFIISAHC